MRFVYKIVPIILLGCITAACIINQRVQNLPKVVLVEVVSGTVELSPETAYNKGRQDNDFMRFEDIIYNQKAPVILSAGQDFNITLFDSESVTFTIRAFEGKPAKIIFSDGRISRQYIILPENRIGLIIGAIN